MADFISVQQPNILMVNKNVHVENEWLSTNRYLIEFY